MVRRLIFLVPDAGYFLGHRLALAKAARAAGWEVEVATAPDARQAEIAALGFVVHSLPFRRHGRNLLGAFLSLAAIWRLYRTRRPDLVHHVTLKAVVLGGLAGRLARVPAMVHAVTGLGYLFTAESWDWRLLRWPVKLAVCLATPAQARLLTEHSGDRALLAWTPGLRARARVIDGSGVDTESFAPAPLPNGPTRFLLASRLLKSKGIESYAAAAAELRAAGVRAEFLLAGDLDSRHPDGLERALLERWKSMGTIEWVGYCADMPSLLASVHAVVLPSAYGEGIPRCLLEGASVGRALIASELPGCRAIAQDKRNGFIVPSGNVPALAAAMGKLAGDRNLLAQFGKASRDLVLERFSDAQITAATLEVYREIT
ncbi:glycosyltransferase family 4 protein [Limibacillus sp. MBR-115]|jgi:glycosyltransferase involved in cell wall biosynthesis|uniref:glycosyltransferase family 4 protein n=1 Tax=Limibacillus sp. MBR-115 TaxID=3156465 RepID=UPI00339141B4